MGSKKCEGKLLVRARSQAADLQDRIGPAIDDARERIGPMVDDARERLTPMVEDARERLTPVVEDAKDKLAALAETVATKLDETLPDKATPEVVKQNSKKGGHKLRNLLVIVGL